MSDFAQSVHSPITPEHLSGKPVVALCSGLVLSQGKRNSILSACYSNCAIFPESRSDKNEILSCGFVTILQH